MAHLYNGHKTAAVIKHIIVNEVQTCWAVSMRSTFCEAKLADHTSSSFIPDDDAAECPCDNSTEESSAGSYSNVVITEHELAESTPSSNIIILKLFLTLTQTF